MRSSEVEWCNWSFDECLTPGVRWLVKRDCSPEITLSRGSGKNWKTYQQSLRPTPQFTTPNAKCPGCGKEVNGVNPYDDGQTWRK